jgi:hypothetical protein
VFRAAENNQSEQLHLKRLVRGDLTPLRRFSICSDARPSLVRHKIFRAVHAIAESLEGWARGKPLNAEASIGMKIFENIIGLEKWSGIEKQFAGD